MQCMHSVLLLSSLPSLNFIGGGLSVICLLQIHWPSRRSKRRRLVVPRSLGTTQLQWIMVGLWVLRPTITTFWTRSSYMNAICPLPKRRSVARVSCWMPYRLITIMRMRSCTCSKPSPRKNDAQHGKHLTLGLARRVHSLYQNFQ